MSMSAHPNHEIKGNRPEGKGRGSSNANQRGSAEQRRRRKEWLVDTYRANKDLRHFEPGSPDRPAFMSGYPFETYMISADGVTCDVPLGKGEKACRCYRCGMLLTVDTVTADRITPGCVKTAEYPAGGTYARKNIRPACSGCNSETGGALANSKALRGKKVKK